MADDAIPFLTCVVQELPPSSFEPGVEPSSAAVDRPPPGDPRLWLALQKNIGVVSSLRSRVLQATWPPGSRIPPFERIKSALEFGGLEIADRLDTLILPSLVVRARGGEADPLATLFSEWCDSAGYSKPANAWAGHLFELKTSLQTPEAPAQVADALDRLLTLGERARIHDPQTEEARVFRAGESLSWPIEALRAFTTDDAIAALLAATGSAEGSLSRGRFLLKEVRPRTPVSAHEFSPAIQALIWEWNGGARQERVDWQRPEGPIHFFATLPRRPGSSLWSQDLRVECEKTAALFDRGSVFLSARSQPGLLSRVENLSPLPLAQSPLPSAPPFEGAALGWIGPWDSRNPAMERRLEYLLRPDLKSLSTRSEFIEGSESWLRRLGQLLPKIADLELDEAAFSQLAALDAARVPTQRIVFVWAMPVQLESLLKAGLPARVLGKNKLGAGLRAGPREISAVELMGLTRGPREVAWTYPELKSPAYGYEKATLFPDRYLAKVVSKDHTQFEWQEELWRIAGGERLRSAPYRNPLCSSIDGFRWTDGKALYAEAIGAADGWSDVDPRAAGIAAVDTALRILVSLGARPRPADPAAGVNPESEALVYMTCPSSEMEMEPGPSDAQAQLETNETVAQGSYLLAAEGICQALESFGFSIRYFNGNGGAFGTTRPEIRVVLRTRISDAAPQVVPGFRMSGEPLYAIGPRPAFMDAGSVLLNHVRVMSNHLSKLQPAAQLELYDLIWELMDKGIITSIRPIREGGIAQTVAEMALWGGMGAQIRPNIPTIELFSGAPGRLLVGILPSETKRFESLIKSELLTVVGTTGTDKLMGLPLDKLKEARKGGVVPV